MSGRWLRHAGVVAAVALAVELLALRWLLAGDAATWHAVLLARGCATDELSRLATDLAAGAVGVLLALAAMTVAWRHGIAPLWPPLATCALGAVVNDLLKEIFVRDRPSNLAAVAVGHSFPSGHVMNAALAAVAVVVLTRGRRTAPVWGVAAATATAAVAAGRLLIGAHWATDVVGGVVAAVAWAGLALPRIARSPLRWPAAVGGVLVLVLLVMRTLAPTTGVRLPSPLLASTPDTIEVDVGEPGAAALTRGFAEGGREPPAGSLMWMEGDGELVFAVRAAHRALDGSARPAPMLLALDMRPATPLPDCVTVGLVLNGRELARFVPFRGWRQYRLPVPAAALRAGDNHLALTARDARGRPWRLAVASLRVRTDRAGQASDPG